MKFTESFGRNSIMTGALRQQNRKDMARRSTAITLRPTEGNKFYRFRLLSFEPDEEFVAKNNFAHVRDYYFIMRYVHSVFKKIPDETKESGFRYSYRSIPCPASDYIKANSNLTKSRCPICSAGNQAYIAYKDSGFKNQVAKQKRKDCKNSFEVLIPVIVLKDPNDDSNEGSAKVLTFNQEQYERLATLIQDAQRSNVHIWNDNAVDLFLTYGKVDKTIPARGDSPEINYKANDIIKMGFTNQQHDIPDIEGLVKEMHFDENWFIVPTIEELEEFYEENIASNGMDLPDDIPDDVPLVSTTAAPAPAPAPAAPTAAPATKKVPAKKVETPVDDLDIPDLSNTAPAPAPAAAAPAAEPAPTASDIDIDVDSFIAGLKS